MISYPAGYSSDEDEFECYGFNDDKPKRNIIYEQRPQNPGEHLIDAVCNNDVAGVEAALIAGASVHFRSKYSNDQSPIMKAAFNGSYEAMVLLLKRGAKADDDLRMYNVLMCLCDSYKQDENVLCKCFDLLLKHGADPLVNDWVGASPLSYAVRRNHQQLAAKLMLSGCSVNKADGEGWTPLFQAVQDGNIKMTKFLIDAGANINMMDRYGGTLGDLAASKDPELLAMVTPPDDLDDMFADLPGTEVRVISSKLKTTILNAPKMEDRLYGFHDDAQQFIDGIGLDYVAKVIARKNVQFSELMTWDASNWENVDVRMSYHLKKIDLCVKKYHEKEWGKGSIPDVCHVISLDHVDLFAVAQFLLNTLRNAHINSTTSLYMLKNYEGKMPPELVQEMNKILKTTALIKKQLAVLTNIHTEIDSNGNIYPPDLIAKSQKKPTNFHRKVVFVCVACVLVLKFRFIKKTIFGPTVLSWFPKLIFR